MSFHCTDKQFDGQVRSGCGSGLELAFGSCLTGVINVKSKEILMQGNKINLSKTQPIFLDWLNH